MMQIPCLPRRVPAAVRSLLLAASLLLVAGSLAAQPTSAPLAPAPPGVTSRAAISHEPPMRLAGGFGVEPLAQMSEARVGALDQLEALTAWNREGRLPVRVGFERPLPVPRSVRFDAVLAGAAGRHAGGVFSRATPTTTVWGASVRVEDAYRLRLRLSDVALPAGARLWVYSDDGESVGPFGAELIHEGELLTPSVAGPSIHLEVELPRAALERGSDAGFRIERVAQTFRLGPSGEPLLERLGALPAPAHAGCLVDVSCVDSGTFEVVDLVPSAIAYMEFPGGSGFVVACTGGLLNTVPPPGGGPAPDPPLLTANHCFSDQGAAAGLEIWWDYVTPSCDGTPTPLESLPRTSGSTLLATGAQSDFTLVGLGNIPAERVLLGWNAEPDATAPGTIVHRVSHPAPDGTPLSQSYSRYETLGPGDARFRECEAGPGQDIQDTSKFLHLQPLQGGTYAGSSGAPSMLGNGQVVGQLFGGCGPGDGADGCDYDNNDIDGAFQTTFDSISGFLVGSDDPLPPSSRWLTTSEQPGFEFQVQITPQGGSPVEGVKIPESECIAETFCAEGALAGRPELFVKIIGPRPNGFLWVQVSRFTPSEVEVWVRQASSLQTNYYRLDPVGQSSDDVSGLQDRQAFSP